MCPGTAIGGPATSTPEWFAYPYNPPVAQQAGSAVVSPAVTAVVSPTGQDISPGTRPRSACSTVDMLAARPAAKPHGTPLMTELTLAELSAAVAVLAAPPVAKPHGAPLMMELLPAELSAAKTPQGTISCASLASAATSSVLDSSNSSLSSGGLDTSLKSGPLSEELNALREGLAELHASTAEQEGELGGPAVVVLKRGLSALERVWVSSKGSLGA